MLFRQAIKQWQARARPGLIFKTHERICIAIVQTEVKSNVALSWLPYPWESSVRVVSLLQVQQFYADIFFKVTARLNAFERLANDEDKDTWGKPEMTAVLYAELGSLMTDSALYGLDSVGLQCQRIMQKMQDRKMLLKCGEIGNDLHNLRTRFEDEFGKHFFLHLSLKEADAYQNPEKNWEAVVARFPKARYNIEESTKCFALNRYGAAVFHMLQAAEYGVIQLGGPLGELGDKPGWSCVTRLQKLVAVPFPQRTPIAQQCTKLLESVLPLTAAMKDSWRHKLDHVDNQIRWVGTDFSPAVAQEIILLFAGLCEN